MASAAAIALGARLRDQVAMQISRSVIMPTTRSPASSITGIAPQSWSHINFAAVLSGSLARTATAFRVIKSLTSRSLNLGVITYLRVVDEAGWMPKSGTCSPQRLVRELLRTAHGNVAN